MTVKGNEMKFLFEFALEFITSLKSFLLNLMIVHCSLSNSFTIHSHQWLQFLYGIGREQKTEAPSSMTSTMSTDSHKIATFY